MVVVVVLEDEEGLGEDVECRLSWWVSFSYDSYAFRDGNLLANNAMYKQLGIDIRHESDGFGTWR
jgi:hypothetical protein